MEDEETYLVKFVFNNEQIDVQLSSKYDYFINLICNILKISTEQIKELALSYKDSDGDNIIISSPEDYDIFFSQVEQKTVDGFITTIKEDSNLDQNQCLINFINYKESIEAQNNNRKQDINDNINYNINENNNMNNNLNYNYNYENKNINDSLNYNYPKINESYNNNNEINNNKENNKDIPIENIIFEYKCSSCDLYPILCKIYYCAKCAFYLCPECKQKNVRHNHELLEIDSKEKLKKIKEKENDEIDKKRKAEENKMKNAMKQYNQNMNINKNNHQYPYQNQNNHIQFKMDRNRGNYYINSHNNNNCRNNGLYFQYNQHNQQNMHQNFNQFCHHNQYQVIEPYRHQINMMNNCQNSNLYNYSYYNNCNRNNYNHNYLHNIHNNLFYNNQNKNDYNKYQNFFYNNH